MDGAGLEGDFFVRRIEPAVQDAQKLFPRVRDRMIARKHVLKLRFWPENHPTRSSGEVLDLDWSWIKALPNSNVGELRIHDEIGGHDNLRAIFFVGDSSVRKPLPLIWILSIFQKKRDEFTKHQIKIFRLRRTLVQERFYGGRIS